MQHQFGGECPECEVGDRVCVGGTEVDLVIGVSIASGMGRRGRVGVGDGVSWVPQDDPLHDEALGTFGLHVVGVVDCLRVTVHLQEEQLPLHTIVLLAAPNVYVIEVPCDLYRLTLLFQVSPERLRIDPFQLIIQLEHKAVIIPTGPPTGIPRHKYTPVRSDRHVRPIGPIIVGGGVCGG